MLHQILFYLDATNFFQNKIICDHLHFYTSLILHLYLFQFFALDLIVYFEYKIFIFYIIYILYQNNFYFGMNILASRHIFSLDLFLADFSISATFNNLNFAKVPLFKLYSFI